MCSASSAGAQQGSEAKRGGKQWQAHSRSVTVADEDQEGLTAESTDVSDMHKACIASSRRQGKARCNATAAKTTYFRRHSPYLSS
jgi:hypothetical protein